MDISIQDAVLKDAEEILFLQKLAYRSEAEIYEDDSIPPLAQTLGEIGLEFDDHLFLKAVRNHRIAGSVRARLIGETCHIGKLIVHPNQQNQGIGSRLMNAVESRFPQAQRFELFTGHRSERNLYLYQKLGYRIFQTITLNERLQLVYLEKRREEQSPTP
ncbi:MAG: GNAT family N-acetyltransferase [Candidatus Omnitrophota bacterium]